MMVCIIMSIAVTIAGVLLMARAEDVLNINDSGEPIQFYIGLNLLVLGITGTMIQLV